MVNIQLDSIFSMKFDVTFFFNMKFENNISANKFGTQQTPSVSPAVHVCTKADIGRDLNGAGVLFVHEMFVGEPK